MAQEEAARWATRGREEQAVDAVDEEARRAAEKALVARRLAEIERRRRESPAFKLKERQRQRSSSRTDRHTSSRRALEDLLR